MAIIAVRTGISPLALLETPYPIFEEIERLLVEEQRQQR